MTGDDRNAEDGREFDGDEVEPARDPTQPIAGGGGGDDDGDGGGSGDGSQGGGDGTGDGGTGRVELPEELQGYVGTNWATLVDALLDGFQRSDVPSLFDFCITDEQMEPGMTVCAFPVTVCASIDRGQEVCFVTNILGREDPDCGAMDPPPMEFMLTYTVAGRQEVTWDGVTFTPGERVGRWVGLGTDGCYWAGTIPYEECAPISCLPGHTTPYDVPTHDPVDSPHGIVDVAFEVAERSVGEVGGTLHDAAESAGDRDLLRNVEAQAAAGGALAAGALYAVGGGGSAGGNGSAPLKQAGSTVPYARTGSALSRSAADDGGALVLNPDATALVESLSVVTGENPPIKPP